MRPLLVWRGYWIDGDGEMTAWEIMEDDDEMKIIESGSLEKGHGWHSYIKVCGDIDDVKNAKIIVAAPELLEALQELVHADCHGVRNSSAQVKALNKAMLAIDKALGR
ncbi:hypothetical protein [Serratia surfactantfaciens]|nr:hypothetical protein [Serratia surfactantfaciens]